MTKISSSPDRHGFQIESYQRRQNEQGLECREDYLAYMRAVHEQHLRRFDSEESKINNLEYDLLTTDWILNRVRNSDVYAQNLYAAMCNNSFQKLEVWPVLQGQEWSCSWRSAGGIIADMRGQGDYIDWYCSGSTRLSEPNAVDPGEDNKIQPEQERFRHYQPEGAITEQLHLDLRKLGWAAVPGGDWEKF